MKRIVFTDLDGTLLDSQTYSYDKSLPAVNRLKERDIPVIFCSAKTRAEQEFYLRALALRHPFIVENGSAIFIPRAYFPFPFDYHRAVDDFLVIELGMPYVAVRRLLIKIKEENGFVFRGFADMNVDEIAEITGLSLELAKLAKLREYDEPIKFDMSGKRTLSKFMAKLGEAGLNWVYGGRLYHVMGGGDKGKAVDALTSLYRKMWGAVESIGLGNSLNDGLMLLRVDIPILVEKESGGWENMDLPRLRKVQGVGPDGWSRAIAEIL